MRFVIDANLPPRLASFLVDRSHHAVHVSALDIGVDACCVTLRRDALVIDAMP